MLKEIFLNVVVTLCNISGGECLNVFDIVPANGIVTERQCLTRAAFKAEAWAEKNRPGYYVAGATCIIVETQGI